MNNKNKSLIKAILPWVLVIILLSSLVPLLNMGRTNEVNYTEFTEIVNKENVTEVSVMPGIYVTSVEGQYTKTEKGQEVNYTFKTNVPQTDQELDSLIQLMEDKGITVEVLDAKSENTFPTSIKNGAPGGWPTSRREAERINSGQSQKLADGSTVSI